MSGKNWEKIAEQEEWNKDPFILEKNDIYFRNFLLSRGYIIDKISYARIILEDDNGGWVDIYHYSISQVHVRIFDSDNDCIFDKEFHDFPKDVLRQMSDTLLDNNVRRNIKIKGCE